MPPPNRLSKAARKRWKTKKEAAARTRTADSEDNCGGDSVAQTDQEAPAGFLADGNSVGHISIDEESIGYEEDSVISITSTTDSSAVEDNGYEEEDEAKSKSFAYISARWARGLTALNFYRTQVNLNRKRKIPERGPGKGPYNGDSYWTERRRQIYWEEAAKGCDKLDSFFQPKKARAVQQQQQQQFEQEQDVEIDRVTEEAFERANGCAEDSDVFEQAERIIRAPLVS